jgi:hypothetical protein
MSARSLKPGGISKIAAALVSFLLVSAFLAAPSVAGASGGGDGCNPHRTTNYQHYYFSGIDDESFPSYYEGIRANIFQYSPYVYNSGGGTDVATQYWAQVGWIEFPGGLRYTVVQFRDPQYPQGGFSDTYPSWPINSTIGYKVTYNPACPVNCFDFYDNYSATPLIGTDWGFMPTDAQAFSEIHDQASQIPGAVQDPSQTSGIQVADTSSSGSWYNMLGITAAYSGANGGTPPAWDKVSPVGTSYWNYYNSWDTACQY